MSKPHDEDEDAPLRIPGLFRSWELAHILQPGTDYRIEDAGETADGAPLVAVWRHAVGAAAPGQPYEPGSDH